MERGPIHMDDDRVTTARILRQNAQTSPKGACAPMARITSGGRFHPDRCR
jgi:hypothetical protein